MRLWHGWTIELSGTWYRWSLKLCKLQIYVVRLLEYVHDVVTYFSLSTLFIHARLYSYRVLMAMNNVNLCESQKRERHIKGKVISAVAKFNVFLEIGLQLFMPSMCFIKRQHFINFKVSVFPITHEVSALTHIFKYYTVLRIYLFGDSLDICSICP